MLNAAVIGIGSMGKNHARIYAELDNVNLAALADTNETLVNELAEKYNAKAYTDYKDMLKNEKLDIISVAVPTKKHKEVALEVINKKINVLIEKPIAADIEEAKEIIDAAKKNKVKLTVGHVERFNPSIIELKKRLEKNELGKIYKINIIRIGPFPPKIRDVGIITDLGVHDLDIIRYLTGSEVKRLYAETEQMIHTQYEDLLAAILKLENNTIVVMSVNWLTPIKVREILVIGEKGAFKADTLKEDLYFIKNPAIKKEFTYQELKKGITGEMTKLNLNKEEPLKAEIKSFINAITSNKEPAVTGEDALKALELAQKLMESSKKEEVIRL